MLFLEENSSDADPNQTRIVLERQPDVVGANVWIGKSGRLVSRVVVTEGSALVGADLQQLCLTELGQAGTPVMIVIEHAKRRVA